MLAKFLFVLGLNLIISTSLFAQTYMIEGRVFFNDQRRDGYFDERYDPTGNPGAVNVSGGAAGQVDNYLAARGMTAQLYEIDTLNGANCTVEPELVSEDLINRHGRFSFEWDQTDACGDGTRIAVVITARLCDLTYNNVFDRCFGVYDGNGDLYEVAYPSASIATPLMVLGADVDLGDLNFETVFPTSPADDHAQAANFFAALLDTTEYAHQLNRIDFEYDSYGELKLRYPVSPTPFCVANAHSIKCRVPVNWTNGTIIMHEYGHTVYARAFGGTLGACSGCAGGTENRNGNASWGVASLEYPQLALTEGFANFMNRATRSRCITHYDENADYGLLPAGAAAPAEGEAYVGNVTKLFCDLRDYVDDDDPTIPGYGDRISMPLGQIKKLINDTYNAASPAQLDVGITACDLLAFYAYGTLTAPAVPPVTTEYLNAQSIAYQNGMDCGFPVPN